MTFREAQAILLLWTACADPETRARAAALVPELTEWETSPPDAARRWRITLRNINGGVIVEEDLVCREADLPAHTSHLAARYDLAPPDAAAEVREL
jgi:hypothetical protein